MDEAVLRIVMEDLDETTHTTATSSGAAGIIGSDTPSHLERKQTKEIVESIARLEKGLAKQIVLSTDASKSLMGQMLDSMKGYTKTVTTSSLNPFTGFSSTEKVKVPGQLDYTKDISETSKQTLEAIKGNHKEILDLLAKMSETSLSLLSETQKVAVSTGQIAAGTAAIEQLARSTYEGRGNLERATQDSARWLEIIAGTLNPQSAEIYNEIMDRDKRKLLESVNEPGMALSSMTGKLLRSGKGELIPYEEAYPFQEYAKPLPAPSGRKGATEADRNPRWTSVEEGPYKGTKEEQELREIDFQRRKAQQDVLEAKSDRLGRDYTAPAETGPLINPNMIGDLFGGTSNIGHRVVENRPEYDPQARLDELTARRAALLNPPQEGLEELTPERMREEQMSALERNRIEAEAQTEQMLAELSGTEMPDQESADYEQSMAYLSTQPPIEPPNILEGSSRSRMGVSRKTGVRHSKRNPDTGLFESNIPPPDAPYPPGPPEEHHARGGWTGDHPGGPKGTDTIPAWLTEGEFVVNAQAAAKNRPLLEAINDDRDARTMSRGGRAQYLFLGGLGMAPIKNVAMGAINMAKFAAAPSSDPAEAISGLGNAVQAAGQAMFKFVPVAGAVTQAAGTLVQGFASLMQAIDGTVDRYGEYSPEIAQAQAMAEIRQTLGDMERAQKVGNELAKYVDARSQLQQNVENLKIDLLKAIMPAVQDAVKLMVKMQPLAEEGMGALTKHLERVNYILGYIFEAVNYVAQIKKKEMDKDEDADLKDPTEQLLNNPNFLHGGNFVPDV